MDMRRVTISVTEAQDAAILNAKKDDQFVRCSYAEVVRQMLNLGLQAYEQKRKEVG